MIITPYNSHEVPSRPTATPWVLCRSGLSFCLYARSRATAERSNEDNDAESSSSRSHLSSSAEKRIDHPQRKHHRNSSSNNNNNSNPNSSKNNNKRQSLSSSSQHRQLNQQLVAAQSASEILSILQQSSKLAQVGAGKSLSVVNFSTALHRLARHATSTTKATTASKPQSRAAQSLSSELREQVTSDPRTALLLASIAECMVDDSKMEFDIRPLANMAWALAKLKLAPPLSALDRYSNHNSHGLLLTTAGTVRQGVMEAGVPWTSSSSTVAHRWMSALTQLAGYVLDVIGETVVQRASAAALSLENQSASPPVQQSHQMQEWSNLLWAWATAGRANERAFGVVIRSMIQQQSEEIRQNRPSGNKSPATTVPLSFTSLPFEQGALRPQDWSNAIWAVASAQCCDSHDQLLVYLAHLLEEYPDFISKFKSQELSNTLWGIATMLSNKNMIRDDSTKLVMNSSAESMRANVRALLEELGRQLTDPRRVINSQDVANTLWALATLEFYDKDIYRGIARRLSPDQAHLYKPQELSNMVWAFATAEAEIQDISVFDTTLVAGLKHPRMPMDPVTDCFAIAAKELIRRPYQFEPQHVANILWALSKLGIRHPALFKAMAAHLAGSDDGSILARGLNEFLTAKSK